MTDGTDGKAARRIGAEGSTTRAALLDAAQQLMLEEGYAAVTSRRVAARAGLKPQLVHYYFRTMDDLFLALFRRGAEQRLVHHARVVESSRPLHALWGFINEPAGTALTVEFAALANHRKAIRAEIAAYAEEFRRQQAEVIAAALARRGIGAEEAPPAAIAALLTAISVILAMEDALGTTGGHAELRSLVDRYLGHLEA